MEPRPLRPFRMWQEGEIKECVFKDLLEGSDGAGECVRILKVPTRLEEQECVFICES